MGSADSPPRVYGGILGPALESPIDARAALYAEGVTLRAALTAVVAARRELHRQRPRAGDAGEAAATAAELRRLGHEETRLHQERARVDAALRRLRGDDA